MGPAAAQAPVAAGAAVRDRLGRQQQKDSGRAGARPPALRAGRDLPGGPRRGPGGAGLGPRVRLQWAPRLHPRGRSRIPIPRRLHQQGVHGHGAWKQNKVPESSHSPRGEKQEATPRGAHVLAGICLECCVPRDREGRPQFPLGPAQRPALEGCPRPLPPTGATCGLAPGTWGLGWGAGVHPSATCPELWFRHRHPERARRGQPPGGQGPRGWDRDHHHGQQGAGQSRKEERA